MKVMTDIINALCASSHHTNLKYTDMRLNGFMKSNRYMPIGCQNNVAEMGKILLLWFGLITYVLCNCAMKNTILLHE